MSKYIDEIHACKGDEGKMYSILEKSFMKIFLDLVLLLAIVVFYTGVLESSAATLPETATISTGTVMGIYAVIYGGFAVFIYLITRHVLPFIIFEIPQCFVLLFNAIKSRIVAKKQDVPSISAEPASPSPKNSQETNPDGEKAEQEIWDYLKHQRKYMFGFAFQWLSDNGNLAGMTYEDFIDYVKQKTGCSVSLGTLSKNDRNGLEFSDKENDDFHKKTKYNNMAELFESLIKKNEILPGVLKICENKERKVKMCK